MRRRGVAGPYVYLSVGKTTGRRSLLYAPEALAGLARRRLALTESVQQTARRFSAINLELLARRELEWMTAAVLCPELVAPVANMLPAAWAAGGIEEPAQPVPDEAPGTPPAPGTWRGECG